jgi:hypothetical protein
VAQQIDRIPPRHRRLLALLLAPVGAALLVAGMVVLWLAGGILGHLAGAVIGLLALLLLGVAHGLFWSARAEEQARYERRLDDAILDAAGACGADCSACAGDCAIKALPRS